MLSCSLHPYKDFGLVDTDRKALAKLVLRGYAADAASRGLRSIWVWACPPGNVPGVSCLIDMHYRVLHMTACRT